MKYSQRVAIFLKEIAYDKVSFEIKKSFIEHGNFLNSFGNDICINLIS